jgi:hypothetical protein
MRIVTMAVCVAALLGAGCNLMEEKALEIVITGETSADFAQNETNASWSKGAIVDVAQELRDILEDNGYATDDLVSAHVTSVSYGTVSFDQPHDWQISGAITVEYDGSTETIVNYASQSVQGALGKKISAPLEQAGVDLINQALDDFIAGANPVLVLTVENGATSPVPSGTDPMIFDWRAWLAVQVIVDESVEVPDPF